jgi:hypothetical protein
LFQAHAVPQRQRQIHIAKPAWPLDADLLQPDPHGQTAGTVLEQRRLLRCADQPRCKRARFEAAAFVEFAEPRNRLLDHSPPHPDAAHQRPVAMDLAVLLPSRMAQVHAPSESNSPAKGNGLGRHYTPNSAADRG